MLTTNASPLNVALRSEIGRLELVIARTLRLTVAVCMVAGILHYLVIGHALALWCTLGGGVYLAWFHYEVTRRMRGPLSWSVRIAIVLVEGTMPWMFIVILTYAQGPEYALGSWVAPMIYAALIVATTARLRPEAPLFVGLSAALTFPVVYFALVYGHLTPSALAEPLYQPAMQLSRAAFFGTGGLMGMLLARGLRKAIFRAEVVARQQELFGKYRIESRIASGGMGTVYRAVYCPEGGFERTVAVKRIHPHLADMPRFVDSFREEAELSARLAHPNIVQVLDFGRVDDTYFLAMEHIDGLTLRALITRLREMDYRLEPRTVVYLAREILNGLAYSHAGARDGRGDLLRVVHRDLCPANVLLSRNGEVKITDFGVARALRNADMANTRTVVGHAAYMAPEQARALPIDERCDLFALGVIVWELLCGRPLFDRGSEGPTLLALISANVPKPSQLVGVHPSWDAFLRRALARDPGQRFPTSYAMALELDALPDAKVSTLPGARGRELATIVQRVSDEQPTRINIERPSFAADDDELTQLWHERPSQIEVRSEQLEHVPTRQRRVG